MTRRTVNCVQLFRGQTRNFTCGHATMNVRNVTLSGDDNGLIINCGTKTTFVKCGMRRVREVRIINLRLGQTVIVNCR